MEDVSRKNAAGPPTENEGQEPRPSTKRGLQGKEWKISKQHFFLEVVYLYTWIFQVCKIRAFSPTKTCQKVEILYIWKIQVCFCIVKGDFYDFLRIRFFMVNYHETPPFWGIFLFFF